MQITPSREPLKTTSRSDEIETQVIAAECPIRQWQRLRTLVLMVELEIPAEAVLA